MINRKEQTGFYTEMGFRLKQIRQTKGVSQSDLALSLGVVSQTIQKYESGEVRMLPEVIQKCAAYFEIPVGYFYGEGHSQKKLSRASLMIASEVMMLPSDEIRKTIYAMVRNINLAWEQDNQNK